MPNLPKNAALRFGENAYPFVILAFEDETSLDRISGVFSNPTGHGLYLIVVVGTLTGTPTFRPQLYLRLASGSNLLLWAATATLSAAGTYRYALYPGGLAGGSPQENVNVMTPREFLVGLDYVGTPASDHADTTVEGIPLL
jgi:hypothetical protein